MKLTFPSIAHSSKYGYAYDSSAWSGTETNSSFRMFETMGDGLTQHSNDWGVTFEYLSDYLQSLGAAMLSNDELTTAVSYVVLRKPDTEKIEFAASVVWKDSDQHWEKRRYYSIKLQKVGGRAKEHDKRFTEITKYQDGSRSSILKLVTSEYADGFERFQNAEAVRLWAGEQKKHVEVGEGWPEWFDGEWRKNNAVRGAMELCRALAEAKQHRERAESILEHYRHAVAVDAARAEAESESIAS